MLSSLITLPSCWHLQNEEEYYALFANDKGDLLSLNHFPIAPDLDADIDDTESVRAFYLAITSKIGAGMIEADAIRLDGLPAARAVLQLKSEQGGFSYVGSCTLPFADRSYVIKVEGRESDPLSEDGHAGHPLIKVRHHLGQLQAETRLAPELQELAPFVRGARQEAMPGGVEYTSAWQHFKALLGKLAGRR